VKWSYGSISIALDILAKPIEAMLLHFFQLRSRVILESWSLLTSVLYQPVLFFVAKSLIIEASVDKVVESFNAMQTVENCHGSSPSDSLIKLESSAKLPRSFLSTLMLESKRLLSAQS